ncbi:Dimerisation domain-containing protein [Singulisphaera sp. GP187]|uniref:methyltransferase n=1 Tax=Singulisphaera sp. GP187 TaxID=1882752 RepID=UPI000925A5A4|nr:methyltransferase [Singulisphaera sp. GP187]SIO58037.1 Dimerisation domain-containing protein [Singulisphaera sp. GP187]
MPEPTAQDQMARMITGSWISQAVYVAAKLGLADRLKDGPKGVEELAQTTGTHARSLYRLLRALASVGIFSEDGAGRFQLTPLAETLRSDEPSSQWAMAVMMGEEHYQAWGDLLGSIRTGETAFDRIYGKPIFDYLGERPEQAALFDAAMTSIHGRETQAFLDAYDLSGINVLADIGGGNGRNLIGILQRYPQMNGILFDLPHVIDRARQNLEQAGVADRCQLIAGNFFDSIPVEADAYFMRHIIHDWDDEKSTRILGNIRRSMPERATLLVVEHVLPTGNQPSFGKLLDLNMLLLPGGAERTADEFRQLYEAAGFQLSRIVPTQGDLSVVAGERANG